MSERPDTQNSNGSSNTESIYPGGGPPRRQHSSSRYQTPTSHRRAPSLFWPIALIGAGVLLLLSNLGLIPATGWAVLWRLWPIALIALGLDVLIGRRSIGGAIISGVLILLLVGFAITVALFAEQIPFIVELARAPIMQSEHVEYPREEITSAKVTVDYTSLPGYLSALQDSGNLIEADVTHRGELFFDVDRTQSHADINLYTVQVGVFQGPPLGNREDAIWNVELAEGVPLDLMLDAGSSRSDFDLSDLTITDFELDAGSGRIKLTLPESSSFDGKIDGGSGSLTIILPPDVGLRLTLEDGSGSLNPGERLRLVSGEDNDDGVWETEDFDTATTQIDLYVDQGSGSINIE